MKFKTRATRPEHLPACLQLLTDRHLYTPEEQEQLIRFWSELITTGCAYSGIAVDTTRNEIIAFSVTIALPDDLANKVHRGECPYIGRTIFQRWLQNDKLYLADRDIGTHNASTGVNLLTIHNGYQPFTTDAEYADLRVTLVQVFMQEHMGLNIRSFAHELYGEPEDTVRTGGIRVLKYENHNHPQLAQDDPHKRPFLTTLHITEAADQRGNYLSDRVAYSFTIPKFHFNFSQRQLLRTALENDTDNYAAQRLYLSLPAIKKRWSSIYEKIEARDPSLLHKEKDGERASGRRGPEFRRQVISYLRDHPEELHPYAVRSTSQLPVIKGTFTAIPAPLPEIIPPPHMTTDDDENSYKQRDFS